MRFLTEFQKIVDKISEQARDIKESRGLEYREGAVGITEIISCPLKAEFRRKHPEIAPASITIDDGFVFESQVKTALSSLYGERFVEEMVLSYDDEDTGVKIDGHLDCGIVFDDLVVGIELKSTVLSYANHITGYPDYLTIVENGEIKVSDKYILQAKLQNFLLRKKFPDKEVETYLFVKTTLKTRWKVGKTILVIPVKEPVSEKEFKEILEKFKNDKTPREPWECYFCCYKEAGICEGQVESGFSFKEDKTEEIKKLLFRRKSLLKELQSVEEQIKKLLNGAVEIDGKQIGWQEVEERKYDLPALVKILKENGVKAKDFLTVKKEREREIMQILGDRIDEVSEVRKKRRFVF